MNTKDRGGPKDWSPWISRHGDGLLTGEERRRLAEIRAKRVKNVPLTEKDEEDILWLCETAKRLSLLKVEEFDFPRRAGLVNNMAGTVFPLRFDATVPIHNEAVMDWRLRQFVLLDFTVEAQISEAILAVRPWIRLGPGAAAGDYEMFRKLLLSFTVDDGVVLKDGPVEEHLVGPDGFGVRRKPFAFRHGSGAFPAAWLVKRPEGTAEDRMQMVGDNSFVAGEHFGIFIVNGQRVVLSVRAADFVPIPYVVTAGLVAARYTTKPE